MVNKKNKKFHIPYFNVGYPLVTLKAVKVAASLDLTSCFYMVFSLIEGLEVSMERPLE